MGALVDAAQAELQAVQAELQTSKDDVLAYLDGQAMRAAQTLAAFLEQQTIGDPQQARVQLEAAKHILKLIGIEVDRREVQGGVQITITHEHAQAVLEATAL